MSGFFVKLVSSWNLLIYTAELFILAAVMVLDKSLCFFRKNSNATCFIIHFNMCSQISALWKLFIQRESDDKNMEISKFWGKEFMSLTQKYEERKQKFSFVT